MESRWTSKEADQIAETAEKHAAPFLLKNACTCSEHVEMHTHPEADAARTLPKRRPGEHWTGPSGEHIEVPLTPRTLTNIRNWGRVIT